MFEEKRLGVDVLDAIVIVGCFGTMSIFPGAVLCWCLSFGRVLVKRTQDNSKKLLMNAFGKQPRYAWLYATASRSRWRWIASKGRRHRREHRRGGAGRRPRRRGMAVIDQQALTGESTPAEKGVGDRVFASTVMVGGKV